MRELRYRLNGKWYKGNTHLHSTASDGGMDFEQLAALYGGAGYDFLFRTDHWVASSAEASEVESEADLTPGPFPEGKGGEKPADTGTEGKGGEILWLDGIEMDGKDAMGAYYHICCLGKVQNMRREEGLEACLAKAHEQGALLILAHPHWTGNTLEEAVRHRLEGVEVYNHVCHWLNGKSNGLVHWEARLRHDPAALALAADDGHLRPEHPGWNGGWIQVNAAELSRAAILENIRAGNFYATSGPEFYGLEWDGKRLQVHTSPVQFIRLVGPKWEGLREGAFDGSLLSEASFEPPEAWAYAYLEIEDVNGKRAWTNNLWV